MQITQALITSAYPLSRFITADFNFTIYTGKFNTGIQGDFCTHEISDNLRKLNISFCQQPKETQAPPLTLEDIRNLCWPTRFANRSVRNNFDSLTTLHPLGATTWARAKSVRPFCLHDLTCGNTSCKAWPT